MTAFVKPVKTEFYRKEFHEGRKAFYAGNLDNPYMIGSRHHKEWTHGFDVSFLENQAKLAVQKAALRLVPHV